MTLVFIFFPKYFYFYI